MNSGSPIAARLSINILSILLVVLIVAAILVILWGISKILEKYKISDSYAEKNKNRPTSKKSINEISKRAKLSADEKELFSKICAEHPLPNINYILNKTNTFNSYLKTEFNSLKNTEDENAKSVLFSLRAKLVKTFETSAVIKTSRVIPIGTSFNYTPSQGIHFLTVLVDTNQSELHFQLPEDLPAQDRPAILSKIKLIFVYKDSMPYEIEVRVVRYQKGKKDTDLLVCTHSDKIFSRTKRAFPRIDLFQDCKFSSVKPEIEGDKTEYKASEKIHEGQLLDISAGGCRITTKLAIKAEQYLKVTAPLDGKTEDSAIGFIIRTTKTKNDEYILHIKFVKIEKNIVNRINALACGYETF